MLSRALLVQSSHAQEIKGLCAENVAVSITFSLSSFRIWLFKSLDCSNQKVQWKTCSLWLDKTTISSRAPNIFTQWQNPKKGNTQTCLYQISFLVILKNSSKTAIWLLNYSPCKPFQPGGKQLETVSVFRSTQIIKIWSKALCCFFGRHITTLTSSLLQCEIMTSCVARQSESCDDDILGNMPCWYAKVARVLLTPTSGMSEACHKHEWVMSQTWMSHELCKGKDMLSLLTSASGMSESVLTHKRVMAHSWTSHGTLMNVSWHTYE